METMREIVEFLKEDDFSKEFGDFARNFDTMKQAWNSSVKKKSYPDITSEFIKQLISKEAISLSAKDRVAVSLTIIKRILPLIEDRRLLSCLDVAHKYVEGKVTEEEMGIAEKEATDLLCNSDNLNNNPFTITMLYMCVYNACRAESSNIGALFDLVEEIIRREDLRKTLKIIKAMKNPFTKED